MHCSHFDAGACGSCTLLPIPRDRQVADGRARVENLLAPFTAQGRSPGTVWEAPVMSADSRFRARARMAVAGTTMEPVLGLPGENAGADLSDCPLHPEPVQAVLDAVKVLVRRAQVPPYDVARRRGELKNVLVTCSSTGAMLLQLVLRSESALPRIREHLPALLDAQPAVVSVSANIHPAHTAMLTGERDIPLAGSESLPMPTGDVVLHARPGSFVQTNTAAAGELYRTAARWVVEVLGAEPGIVQGAEDAPELRIWDLYCGLGGFALHIARAASTAERIASPDSSTGPASTSGPISNTGPASTSGPETGPGTATGSDTTTRLDPNSGPISITGVEVSADAIAGARESAAGLLPDPAPVALDFLVDDAATWAQRTAGKDGPPDLLVVNPPRRGIGPELADWIESTTIQHVVYSSCNPTTLAKDLQRMPSLRIVRGRYVDMFPHTAHAEVVVLLQRAEGASRR